MPTCSLRTPSYRHHKPSGQAVVTLDGRDFYLGAYGTQASRAEYDRIIAEWLHNGRRLPSAASDLSVAELALAFLRWAVGYYVKDGKPTGEVVNVRYALKLAVGTYGHTAARDFGPGQLKTVREQLIASGLCRSEVNRRVRILVRMFRWGVAEGIVPPAVHQALKCVDGLRRGRGAVRESKPVRPAVEAFVDAVLPFLSRQVKAMVELERLTGMRPGEVISMRTCDLDTTGRIWTYTPSSHKTEHHDRARVIYLGPQAQAILKPWLRTDLDGFLFQPREAVAERMANRRAGRQSPMTPSQKARGRKRKVRKAPGEKYTTDSYSGAVAYACKRAGVPAWHPNQLRHSAATRLRKEFGLDAARAVLGHASPDMTLVYAEVDGASAAAAMLKIG